VGWPQPERRRGVGEPAYRDAAAAHRHARARRRRYFAIEGPMTVDEMLTQARGQLQRLEPSEAADAVRSGSVLVDVRTIEQRDRDGAVPGALAVALNVLEWRADPSSGAHDQRLGHHDVPLIVLCAEGFCSSLAAARLVALGRNATDVIGGFEAWSRAGLPVVDRTREE
jgi:rhodanese-related sulfurtransferase